MRSKIYIGDSVYLEVISPYRQSWKGYFTGRWRIDTIIYDGRRKEHTLFLEVKTGLFKKRWISEEKIWHAFCFDTIEIKGEIQQC